MTSAPLPFTVKGQLPTLDSPVLIVMLNGWIDASGAANAAMEHLKNAIVSRDLITFDGDAFIDYRARRPLMQLRDGVITKLDWSAPRIMVGHDANNEPILLLTGPEPDSRWQHFAQCVVELSEKLNVRRMLGMGAYPIATPHTRAVKISCTSPDAHLSSLLPFIKSSVDVPAGMEAVLEQAMFNAGIQSVGLWAQVPHYVASMSYPAAAAALIAAVCDTGGISVDGDSLREQAGAQRERLDDLVRGNSEHLAMLAQLETAFDNMHSDNGIPMSGFGGGPLPSGDELAAELEQFLRDNQAD
jgi:proteasome assembly chaperone (PAC2) family protein